MGKRLNRRRCVVCGKKPAAFRPNGYFFLETGLDRLKVPLCEEHLTKADQYANPVFENPAAKELFRKMYPSCYWQDVADKIPLFLDSKNQIILG